MDDQATKEEAKPTVKSLTEELHFVRAECSRFAELYEGAREARNELTAWKKEAEVQFEDLKMKLLAAEAINQEMRGYISRVQEDDVVREELVATGDRDAPYLVPKRKHQAFAILNPYEYGDGRNENALYGGAKRTRRHWITYGRNAG